MGAKLAPMLKALVPVVLGIVAVVAQAIFGTLDTAALVKIAVATLVTSTGVYATPNRPG